MKLTRTLVSISLTTLLCASLSAHAQFAKVDDAVEYRKAALVVLETHFKRIGAVVKGSVAYDKAAVENDATIVDMMSKLPWSAFPEGSGTANSQAKPEIWTEPAKFKAAAEELQENAAKLSAAAKSGDLNAIKTAFAATGKSCKSCHEEFKSRK